MFLHLRGRQEGFAGQRFNQCLLLDLSEGLTDTSDIDFVPNGRWNSRTGKTLQSWEGLLRYFLIGQVALLFK